MVPNAGDGLRGKKVAARGLEELQHRLVFERRRIGEVDHHLRAGMTASRPSPVMVLTPLLGEAAMTSWPPWRRMATDFEPIRPVPPMTTIFMW